jgi:hypothetical protein
VQALYDSIRLPTNGSGLDPGALALTDKTVGTLDTLAMYTTTTINSDDDCSDDSDSGNGRGDAPDDVFDEEDDVSTTSESGESLLMKL